MHWLSDLFTNPFLITAFSSWLIAQVLKVIINAVITKELNWERLIGDGGMPSAHSATVSSLAVFTMLSCGAASLEFAVVTILAFIVCHDAMGVRQETGKQAVIINELLEVLNRKFDKNLPDPDLKEFVGHTPLQVAAGIIIGICNACLMFFCIL